MTTVAWMNGVLAVDSRVTSTTDGTQTDNILKMFCPSGLYVSDDKIKVLSLTGLMGIFKLINDLDTSPHGFDLEDMNVLDVEDYVKFGETYSTLIVAIGERYNYTITFVNGVVVVNSHNKTEALLAGNYSTAMSKLNGIIGAKMMVTYGIKTQDNTGGIVVFWEEGFKEPMALIKPKPLFWVRLCVVKVVCLIRSLFKK